MYNKKTTYIKPHLKFFLAGAPVIGIWIQNDYENANSRDDVFSLVHKWLNISETTNNVTKKQWYAVAAMGLYSILTNRSYESNLSL